MRRIDIVVPVFNEEAGILRFHQALCNSIRNVPYQFRIIYIDDGSTDNTVELLNTIVTNESNVIILELSRNFGHQAALTAGLDHCDADIVVMMDGDGQHPPHLIPEMIRLHELGYDIVQSQRAPSSAESAFKRTTSRSFYNFLNVVGSLSLVEGTADFRLITRDVAQVMRQMPEYHRFVRGMISWVGFKQILLPYTAAERIAGASKYTFRRMWRLATDGIFSFSLMPLRLGIVLGCGWLIFATFEIFYVTWFWLSGRQHVLVPGWSSLIILTTAAGGIMMILLGFIGVYVGMIFQQVKQRPVYIVRRQSAIDGTRCIPTI